MNHLTGLRLFECPFYLIVTQHFLKKKHFSDFSISKNIVASLSLSCLTIKLIYCWSVYSALKNICDIINYLLYDHYFFPPHNLFTCFFFVLYRNIKETFNINQHIIVFNLNCRQYFSYDVLLSSFLSDNTNINFVKRWINQMV